MIWKNRGHEFDDVACRVLDSNREYIIWGAGTFGETFCREFKDRIKIKHFVDSDRNKQSRIVLSRYDVVSPTILNDKDANVSVIVSTGRTGEVYPKLEKMGYRRWMDYYHIDDFASIYYMYKENTLFANFLSVPLTDYCTLRCEKCSALNPYLKSRKHRTKDEVLHNLDTYFSIVDRLDVLALSGGDSFLNPHANEIIEAICMKYYGSRINNVEIYSNAIIIPDEGLISTMKKYDMIYRFTDYGKETSEKQHCDEVEKLLKDNKIRFDRAHFDNWCDCGYPQESNGINDLQNLINFFSRCDRKSCQTVYNDQLIYCGMAVGADMVGYCKLQDDDGFNLLDHGNERIKYELLEYILGYNTKGFMEYCKKCNGGPNINNHYVIPGKQMNRR